MSVSKSSGSPRGSFITSHPSCVTQPSLQNAAGTHQGSHCIPDPLSQCCTGTHEKSHPCSLKRWNSNIREGEQQPPQSWGCPWTLPAPSPRAGSSRTQPQSRAAGCLTWQVWQEYALSAMSVAPSSLFPVTRAFPEPFPAFSGLDTPRSASHERLCSAADPCVCRSEHIQLTPIYDIWQKGKLCSPKSCFALMGNLLILLDILCAICAFRRALMRV